MNNCSWCNLTDEDKQYLLYENQYWAVYLADEQDYIGRCIIVSRRHCASLAELDGSEWDNLRTVIQMVENSLKSVLGADLCNWSCLMNDSYKDTEPNPHLHLHCRPRFKNPVTINGNEYGDEEFGHHYKLHKGNQLIEADKKCLFKSIRKAIYTEPWLIIRKASKEEMLSLWGYQDVNNASPTAKFFYNNIESGNAIFWTVDNQGELIAELYTFKNLYDKDFADGQSAAYLCAFRVREDLRGRGIGSRLLNQVLDELKLDGFSKATIGVSPDEQRNIKLYRNNGFTYKIKDCYLDPCAVDEKMQPKTDEGFWLLSKEL